MIKDCANRHIDAFKVFAYSSSMPRVLMNFDRYTGFWWVHFIEADCRTLIGPKTRCYRFATLDGFRLFVVRCNPEGMDSFEHSVRACGRGSTYVNLTYEQYAKLKGSV